MADDRPFVPPGTNPDDVRIAVLASDDYDILLIVHKDGKVEISTAPGLSPAMFCGVLMSMAHEVMQDQELTIADVAQAQSKVSVHNHPPDDTPASGCVACDAGEYPGGPNG